jgi:hypothetical protein
MTLDRDELAALRVEVIEELARHVRAGADPRQVEGMLALLDRVDERLAEPVLSVGSSGVSGSPASAGRRSPAAGSARRSTDELNRAVVGDPRPRSVGGQHRQAEPLAER